ncbi:MAG: GIY-YIG nuclease family protein [Flavobacteriales bacterium]|nr:GIY-YIG nuclease family protein [Bacteroidota bacterium]MCB9241267.1 GIY-YIG nuclease family protein [Flavobacteriales bacterium]
MQILNSLSWCVYLLRCVDGTIYTGCSSNLAKRLNDHQNGRVKYTKSLQPIELICVLYFNDRNLAYKFEKYMKSGSGRAFRRRLINVHLA